MEYGLSLGSNIGDRLHNLRQAAEMIGRLKEVSVLDHSPVYETEPVDVPDQFSSQAFLNSVLIVESGLMPSALLDALHLIEQKLGRPAEHEENTPRTIDIDIIYAGEITAEEPGYVFPHPRWQERRFVVQPLSDLRPGLVIPGASGSVKDILKSLPKTPKVSLFQAGY